MMVYALVKDSENDFGQEVIDTLVKRMEDDRHQLVVIVAADGDMRSFNPMPVCALASILSSPLKTGPRSSALFSIVCAPKTKLV